MNERRPDDEPDIYTMPPTAYRVAETAGAPAPQEPSVAEPGPVGAEPAPAASGAAPRRRTPDLVASILLIVVGAAAAGLGSVLALFLAFASDGCGAGTCDFDRMNAGFIVALAAPWVAWLLGVVVTIVRLSRRRLAFWVPLAGMLLGALGWALGAWLVGSALG